MIVLRVKKRISALLLAVCMALGLSVPALAAQVKGSITIAAPGTALLYGKTLEAYRILDGRLANEKDPAQGTVYTVPVGMEDFYAEFCGLDQNAPGFNQAVLDHLAAESDLRSFAGKALEAARKNELQPGTATAGDRAEEVKIEPLDLGCYVVEDQENTLPVVLTAVCGENRDPRIVVKTDRPTLKKEIDCSRDHGTASWGQTDCCPAAMGDTIHYKLTTKVPDMKAYSHYYFVIRDTLAPGLAYQQDLKVWMGRQELQELNQYTVQTKALDDGSTELKIVFDRFVDWKDRMGTEITVRYSAQLTQEALVGTVGNENAANLTYSRDPGAANSGGNEPGPEDSVGVTPDSVTRTYTTGIRLVKTDRMGQRLAGAKFKLEGEGLNTVVVRQNIYVRDDRNGEYWKLKNGSYTNVPPLDATQDQYENVRNKYIRSVKSQPILSGWQTEYSGETGVDGELRFDGLSAGKYTLTEIEAPEGYRLMEEPISLNILWKKPVSGETACTWEVQSGATVKNGLIQVVAVNEKGGTLPETGGMGTGPIYLLGGGLTAAALFLLLRKRRSAE